MKEKEYIIDDTFEIPEYIRRMSKEDVETEIERLEKEHREKKQKELVLL